MSKSAFLVHGGFADGSGWSRVYDILKKESADLFGGTAARVYRCRPQPANTRN